MLVMWMPAQTTVPPGASALSAAGTSSPAEAKMIAASSGSGGSCSLPPAQTAPNERANCRPRSSPAVANQRWSLDFVADQFTDGRRFRILEVYDDCTRECLALVADTSLSGIRMARELDRLMIEREAEDDRQRQWQRAYQ